MPNESVFTPADNKIDDIPVHLSYTIVDLFSEDLYSSPNKAIEELVSNSFDAGAQNVHVLFSSDHAKDAAIAVIDDGQGMGPKELKQHWRIGKSGKRELPRLPRGRKQIGKFGIGKLATYVLANSLTHISKVGAKYYLASMDYRRIDKNADIDVGSEELIKIPLYERTAEEAKQKIRQWIEHTDFTTADMPLFGPNSPDSWTVTVMSDLKAKAGEIKEGKLRWVLRTALPMRPDFSIWLKGENLQPSKINKDLLKRWTIGKDLINLHRERLKSIKKSVDRKLPDEHRFGIYVPGLGRVTGYAEAYKEKLTDSKSDEIGRSHGFFVYVYERLINAEDDHFGILSSDLRHGTFVCFRLVVHMDGLDGALRSNRESIGDSDQLDIAREVLRAIFNIARNKIEEYHRNEKPGAKLASNLAASPASLSRRPIVDLTRAVAKGDKKSRYLIVPNYAPKEQEAFLADLDQRAQDAKQFVTGVDIDNDGLLHDVMVKFNVETGRLQLNRPHPFVDTFRDTFTNKNCGQSLEPLLMAEVLAEAHFHLIGIKQDKIDKFLSMRDQLLRDLANKSGRPSVSSVAEDLLNASSHPTPLEKSVVAAFCMLGFKAEHIGGPNEPDGVAIANLSAHKKARRSYKVSLEAKSTKSGRGKVSAKTVGVSGVVRQRDKYACDHSLVVGPGFHASSHKSALGKEIQADRRNTKRNKMPRTITLIEIAKLAVLVKLRPKKQITLSQMRKLFQTCVLPHESAEWIKKVQNMPNTKPLPHRRIIEAIGSLQKDFSTEPVAYGDLRVNLSRLEPPIIYHTNGEVRVICEGMAALAPNAISVTRNAVALEQSVENAIDDIKNGMDEIQ